MYRTIVKRAGVNPLTGKKQYKVCACYDWHHTYRKVVSISGLFDSRFNVMGLKTPIRYQPGTFINPRKAMAYAIEPH